MKSMIKIFYYFIIQKSLFENCNPKKLKQLLKYLNIASYEIVLHYLLKNADA